MQASKGMYGHAEKDASVACDYKVADTIGGLIWAMLEKLIRCLAPVRRHPDGAFVLPLIAKF